MEGKADIVGLKDAMRTLQAVFPDDYKKQSRLVNGAMGGSARKSFLPIAKQLALRGDGSGALSESLAVRAQKANKRKGKAGGMEVVPVRYSLKAMAKYISHYYTSRGKNMPLGGIDGIRHGHLVEFGFVHKKSGQHVPARPYLWPSTVAIPKYRDMFASELKKRIAATVKREAKKRAKK